MSEKIHMMATLDCPNRRMKRLQERELDLIRKRSILNKLLEIETQFIVAMFSSIRLPYSTIYSKFLDKYRLTLEAYNDKYQLKTVVLNKHYFVEKYKPIPGTENFDKV